MKKYLIISMACLFGMMSCSKDIKKGINEADLLQEPETITFSAGIDIDVTKATVSGLTITWNSSDRIAVANDINDEIQTCAITRDDIDHTKCTFTVEAVAGATTYYAICKGSSTDGITFDHTTGTFSGLNLSKYSFDSGELSGSSISIAGKSTDKASFSMKPCLSLVRFRMHEESVTAKYAGGYSGIRGLYFIAKNGSRVYVAGDYTVDLSGDMAVQYVNNGNKKDDHKIDSNELLTAGVDYYFTVLPAGAVTSMEFRFLGFNSDESVSDTEGIYTMSTSQTVSFDPGDCFNFGTLNPVGLKKDKDNPAISIDGAMTDWVGVDAIVGDGNRITEWKYKSDSFNVYFYLKVTITGGDQYAVRGTDAGFAMGININDATGTTLDEVSQEHCDYRVSVYPFTNAKNTTPVTCGTGTGSIKPSPFSSYNGSVPYAGTTDSDYAYVEFSVPRNKIGYPASGSTIKVKIAAGSTKLSEQSITVK